MSGLLERLDQPLVAIHLTLGGAWVTLTTALVTVPVAAAAGAVHFATPLQRLTVGHLTLAMTAGLFATGSGLGVSLHLIRASRART